MKKVAHRNADDKALGYINAGYQALRRANQIQTRPILIGMLLNLEDMLKGQPLQDDSERANAISHLCGQIFGVAGETATCGKEFNRIVDRGREALNALGIGNDEIGDLLDS